MKRTIRILVACSAIASGGIVATAHAQTPPPNIPPANCEKPSNYVSPDPTPSQRDRLKKTMDDYKACVNAYTKVNNTKAQELVAQAQAYQDAANKVIEEYNAFVNEMNAKTNPPK